MKAINNLDPRSADRLRAILAETPGDVNSRIPELLGIPGQPEAPKNFAHKV